MCYIGLEVTMHQLLYSYGQLALNLDIGSDFYTMENIRFICGIIYFIYGILNLKLSVMYLKYRISSL